MENVTIGKRPVLGLWSFQFLTFLRRGVFYSFMYIYLFSLLGNVTTTAALGALTMLMSAAGQNLLWGRISDRYRLRAQLIVIGEVAAGIAYVIVFVVHKFFIDARTDFAAGLALIGGLAVLEFFWSMSDVGWAALVTDITTNETRGGFVGAVNFINSLGRMAGIFTASLLYEDGLGFRHGTIFYVVTVMLFSGAAIMWFASRSIRNSQTSVLRQDTKERTPVLQETTMHAVKSRSSDGDERTFFWFLIALTIIVLGTASVSQIFPLFLQLAEGLGANDAQIGSILIAYTIGGMVSSVIAGRLADKIGRSTVILAGLILAAVTPMLYTFATTVTFMAIVYGTNGLAFMTLQTAGFALAGDVIPEHRRGRLLSRYNAVMALSWGPAGLLIGGPIADIQTHVLNVSAHTAYINAFIISSVLVLIGTSVFVLKVRRRVKHAF